VTDFVVVVVAHPKRREWITELCKAGIPDLIQEDRSNFGASLNHHMALRRAQDLAHDSWLVVLEDDCLPVEGFRDQLAQALEVAPSPVVSLYAGTGYPAQYQARFTQAVESEACWLLHRQLRHAVGYALAPGISASVILGMEFFINRRFAPDDAISAWAASHGHPVAYTNPSLVDHRDTATIIDVRMHLGHPTSPGRKRPRKAYKVGQRSTWNDMCEIVEPL